MKKYIVIGNPIEHSLSPELHNYWIKNNNIDAIYKKQKINGDEIGRLVSKVNQSNYFILYSFKPFINYDF